MTSETRDVRYPRRFPYVEIIEQPAAKSLRFRYECEGRISGSITGASSTPRNRTHPTIRVNDWPSGRGIVVVSCVTKDEPYRPHPHNLIGKGTCERGVCRIIIKAETPLLQFNNLSVQCLKKSKIFDSLTTREQLRIDPFKTGFDHKHNAASMDLNSLRLCFQVFVQGRDGRFTVALRPVVSDPIYDKKLLSELTICKMSHESAPVTGGTPMIVLCEKVNRENVQVRFFELHDDQRVWESFGDFHQHDVHKQLAIAFRTPSYKNRNITEPKQVWVELCRSTDNETSEALPFKFLPNENINVANSLKRKRRRYAENSGENNLLRDLQIQSQKEMANFFEDVGTNTVPMDFHGSQAAEIPATDLFGPCPKWPETIAPSGDRGDVGNVRGNPTLIDVSRYGAEASPGTLPSLMAHGIHDETSKYELPTDCHNQFLTNRDVPGRQGQTSVLDIHRESHDSPGTTTTVYQSGLFGIPEEVIDAVVVDALDSNISVNNLFDSAELEACNAGLSESGRAIVEACGVTNNDGEILEAMHVNVGNYDCRWGT